MPHVVLSSSMAQALSLQDGEDDEEQESSMFYPNYDRRLSTSLPNIPYPRAFGKNGEPDWTDGDPEESPHARLRSISVLVTKVEQISKLGLSQRDGLDLFQRSPWKFPILSLEVKSTTASFYGEHIEETEEEERGRRRERPRSTTPVHTTWYPLGKAKRPTASMPPSAIKHISDLACIVHAKAISRRTRCPFGPFCKFTHIAPCSYTSYKSPYPSPKARRRRNNSISGEQHRKAPTPTPVYVRPHGWAHIDPTKWIPGPIPPFRGQRLVQKDPTEKTPSPRAVQRELFFGKRLPLSKASSAPSLDPFRTLDFRPKTLTLGDSGELKDTAEISSNWNVQNDDFQDPAVVETGGWLGTGPSVFAHQSPTPPVEEIQAIIEEEKVREKVTQPFKREKRSGVSTPAQRFTIQLSPQPASLPLLDKEKELSTSNVPPLSSSTFDFTTPSAPRPTASLSAFGFPVPTFSTGNTQIVRTKPVYIEQRTTKHPRKDPEQKTKEVPPESSILYSSGVASVSLEVKVQDLSAIVDDGPEDDSAQSTVSSDIADSAEVIPVSAAAESISSEPTAPKTLEVSASSILVYSSSTANRADRRKIRKPDWTAQSLLTQDKGKGRDLSPQSSGDSSLLPKLNLGNQSGPDPSMEAEESNNARVRGVNAQTMTPFIDTSGSEGDSDRSAAGPPPRPENISTFFDFTFPVRSITPPPAAAVPHHRSYSNTEVRDRQKETWNFTVGAWSVGARSADASEEDGNTSASIGSFEDQIDTRPITHPIWDPTMFAEEVPDEESDMLPANTKRVVATRTANIIDSDGMVVSYPTARVMGGGVKIGDVVRKQTGSASGETDDDSVDFGTEQPFPDPVSLPIPTPVPPVPEIAAAQAQNPRPVPPLYIPDPRPSAPVRSGSLPGVPQDRRARPTPISRSSIAFGQEPQVATPIHYPVGEKPQLFIQTDPVVAGRINDPRMIYHQPEPVTAPVMRPGLSYARDTAGNLVFIQDVGSAIPQQGSAYTIGSPQQVQSPSGAIPGHSSLVSVGTITVPVQYITLPVQVPGASPPAAKSVEYCGDFRTKGRCRFGDKCRYSHEPEPGREPRKRGSRSSAAGTPSAMTGTSAFRSRHLHTGSTPNALGLGTDSILKVPTPPTSGSLYSLLSPQTGVSTPGYNPRPSYFVQSPFTIAKPTVAGMTSGVGATFIPTGGQSPTVFSGGEPVWDFTTYQPPLSGPGSNNSGPSSASPRQEEQAWDFTKYQIAQSYDSTSKAPANSNPLSPLSAEPRMAGSSSARPVLPEGDSEDDEIWHVDSSRSQYHGAEVSVSPKPPKKDVITKELLEDLTQYLTNPKARNVVGSSRRANAGGSSSLSSFRRQSQKETPK